jgi:hypothetical protein
MICNILGHLQNVEKKAGISPTPKHPLLSRRFRQHAMLRIKRQFLADRRRNVSKSRRKAAYNAHLGTRSIVKEILTHRFIFRNSLWRKKPALCSSLITA